MAATATITAIDTSGPGVAITLGKRGYRFASLQAAKDYIQARMTETELAELLAMAKAIQISPTLGNPAALLGHGVTFDITKPANIAVVF